VRLLRWSATVALLASALLWLPMPPVWLGVVLFVMFTHTSSMMPMAEAAMAHLVSRGGHFDTRLYGRVRLWGSIGFLVTVFVAGSWFELFGMGHFPFVALLSLALVLACVWQVPDMKEAPHTQAASQPVGAVLRQPVVRWFFASVFFHVLSHIAVYVFFSLYLDSLGYSKTLIGMLWAVSVLAEIVWFYFQSRWLPAFSLVRWLLVCSVLMVLRTAITAGLGPWMLALLLAQIIHAVTFAAHHTVCVALLNQYFPDRLRGRGQALYTVAAYGFPGVIGALSGGVISEHLGLSAVFWVSCLVSLVAVGAAWQMGRLAVRRPFMAGGASHERG
jgi:MFS transporter, PPP family, 3-phenylpropionic acid transporter